MAETPKRAGPTALATSTATIYTAPSTSSTWAIVRQISVTNEGTAAATVTVGVGTSNTDSAGKRWPFKGSTVNPGEVLEWSGYMPLIGGASPDLLYALASAGTTLNITVGVVEGP
jgi:hypothetical protein